ncbi:hypothetical protein DUI87_06510 [Hirundo rustica rustica]|uniref:Uncharacterized protein n=1 Tax=Hirundo rustica rustica TaxID=333673 RepID=A0A3M0KTQ9_HIRRU|nr:hypothetical protein DUI87_06510 [Hirundo rustica rustica]
MESGQGSGQLPPKGEQQAQLYVTCLSLAKGKKKKDPPTGNQGVYMDNEEKYQKVAQAVRVRPRFKMLKVQECSGGVVMTQQVKKFESQRDTQLQQLEEYTQH